MKYQTEIRYVCMSYSGCDQKWKNKGIKEHKHTHILGYSHVQPTAKNTTDSMPSHMHDSHDTFNMKNSLHEK